MPKLIWRQTEGRFKETVAMIEAAEQAGVRGWIELHERLKDSLPPDSSAAPPDELL